MISSSFAISDLSDYVHRMRPLVQVLCVYVLVMLALLIVLDLGMRYVERWLALVT